MKRNQKFLTLTKTLLHSIVLIMVMFALPTKALFAKPQISWLEQGWSDEQRSAFYQTPQGSYLIPKAWFLALEMSDSALLLASPQNISQRFGYLLPVDTQQDSYAKKYADESPKMKTRLPLGFAIESRPGQEDWIGFTCAACHTNDIVYRKHRIRVDGAPTLANFERFYLDIHAAIQATLYDEKKFSRFARRTLGKAHYDGSAKTQLRAQMTQWFEESSKYLTRNPFAGNYGYGRLDAFGIIMNELFGNELGVDENTSPPNAPVSYPFLWGTPTHDFVQWNGSANNPLGRNVGEVLGAFGHVSLKSFAELGSTTARVKELIELENLISTLKAPAWPEEIFGSIDHERVARGAELYQESRLGQPACVACHALKGPDGQYPLTPAIENRFGKQFVQTQMIPLPAIGTDPTSAMNFVTRTVDTAHLGPVLPSPYTGIAQLPAPVMLSVIVGLAVNDGLSKLNPPLTQPEFFNAIGYRVPAPGYPDYAPPNLVAYRARPLDGIWATAPYLHNGSVLNLKELLLPVAERQKQFYVGSRVFDPVNVGFKNKPHHGRPEHRSTLLNTELDGNTNTGHEYGTWLSAEERMDLIEFLKTL